MQRLSEYSPPWAGFNLSATQPFNDSTRSVAWILLTIYRKGIILGITSFCWLPPSNTDLVPGDWLRGPNCVYSASPFQSPTRINRNRKSLTQRRKENLKSTAYSQPERCYSLSFLRSAWERELKFLTFAALRLCVSKSSNHISSLIINSNNHISLQL